MHLNWRQLYFVLSSLLGLVLIVIGATTLLNNVLQQSYFKPQRYPEMPPTNMAAEDALRYAQRSDLPADQKQVMAAWTKDYESWKARQASYDPEAEQRKRALANGITLLLVGIPVFVLHAPFVFRDEPHRRT